MRKFTSITTKILLITLISSILLTSILISISHRMTTQTFNNINTNNAIGDVNIYSDYMGQWFKERFREMETYSNQPIVKSMEWNKIAPYLKGEINRKRNIYRYFLLSDLNGNTYTTLNNKANVNISNLLKHSIEGEVFICDNSLTNSKEDQVCMVSFPIYDYWGDPIAIISGAIDLKNIYRIIKNFKVDDSDSYTYIVDKNGVVLVHPDSELVLNSTIIPNNNIIDKLSNQRLDLSFKSQTNGTVKYTFKNITSLAHFKEIPYTDNWKIVTKIPQEYSIQSINSINKRLLIIGIIGIFISAILSILTASTISRPIIKLKNVIVDSTKGNFIKKVEIESNDEVGILTESFNHMIDVIGELTYYDLLTGLPGRKIFEEQLEMAISHSKRNKENLAIMIIGIDKFKYINDVYGLSTGDYILKAFAKRIKESLRKEDVVCRITGDEFALFFPEIKSQKQALRLAEVLLDIIKKPYIISTSENIYITASGGLSFYPKDGDNRDILVKNANIALHRAKQKGGATYQLYNSLMKEELLEQLEIEKMMVSAIEREEFNIYYQPIINVKDMDIIGMEALLRWEHPVLGTISPGKFIPIAEENGLIIPLGRLVLRKAALQNKKWQSKGYKKAFVAVNISLRQFQDNNFVDMVRNILHETDLEPQWLALEITESIAMENEEYALKILRELKSMGVRIAIDDFGTGYSSLGYLDKFPIDTLKIDKSFIQNLSRGDNKGTIASTIIAMGHSLNVKITAEGVESQDQLKYLMDHKCDHLQGFLFSKPVNKEEFEGILNQEDYLQIAATME